MVIVGQISRVTFRSLMNKSKEDLAHDYLAWLDTTLPRPMSSAPRDGTHFLAYLYRDRDDENTCFGEWREIFYKPYEAVVGWDTCWHAGDPFDSHTGNMAPEHFGKAVPIAWLPLPDKPMNVIE